MPERLTYLAVDFGCLLFPFIFSFFPQFNFYKQWRYFLAPCIVTALFFIIWDIIFTHLGVWSFNPRYVLGYFAWGLPLEEYLFFICIPYACIFTYHCLTLFFTIRTSRPVRIATLIASLALLLTGLLHITHLYTSVTFLLLALYLSGLSFRKEPFLAAFFVAYAIILIPFFISNGILTGSFLNRIVVQYNNNHNLGIRMLTIPLEDTFYGMLLMLMNVAGYERLKQKG